MLFRSVASVALLTAACASTPAPKELSTNTAASIRSAEELSAENNPEAALHLELARRNYADAKELMDKDKNDAARMKLERAESDAELAIVLAKADRARSEASEELQKVRKLKKEMR